MVFVDKRNHFLDFFRFIAAVGIILVHIKFRGALGSVLASVGLWGVAFFAVISGYACHGDNREVMSAKILKRLRRTAVTTALTLFCYAVFSFFFMKSLDQADLWIQGFTDPWSYLRMVILGDFDFFYAGTFWYLAALIYSYVIFYFLVRFNHKKLIYILTPVTLILRIIVDTYVRSFYVSWHMSANWLIGVLPMMLLGYVIADQKERLEKIPVSFLISGSVLSAAAVMTASCVKLFGFDFSQVFIILCAAFVFITGIRKPDLYICKPVAYLGKEDSLYIYLIHVIVILLLRNILNCLPVSKNALCWLLPAASVIFSVLTARLISLAIKAARNIFAKS